MLSAMLELHSRFTLDLYYLTFCFFVYLVVFVIERMYFQINMDAFHLNPIRNCSDFQMSFSHWKPPGVQGQE